MARSYGESGRGHGPLLRGSQVAGVARSYGGVRARAWPAPGGQVRAAQTSARNRAPAAPLMTR